MIKYPEEVLISREYAARIVEDCVLIFDEVISNEKEIKRHMLIREQLAAVLRATKGVRWGDLT